MVANPLSFLIKKNGSELCRIVGTSSKQTQKIWSLQSFQSQVASPNTGPFQSFTVISRLQKYYLKWDKCLQSSSSKHCTTDMNSPSTNLPSLRNIQRDIAFMQIVVFCCLSTLISCQTNCTGRDSTISLTSIVRSHYKRQTSQIFRSVSPPILKSSEKLASLDLDMWQFYLRDFHQRRITHWGSSSPNRWNLHFHPNTLNILKPLKIRCQFKNFLTSAPFCFFSLVLATHVRWKHFKGWSHFVASKAMETCSFPIGASRHWPRSQRRFAPALIWPAALDRLSSWSGATVEWWHDMGCVLPRPPAAWQVCTVYYDCWRVICQIKQWIHHLQWFGKWLLNSVRKSKIMDPQTVRTL